jgi:hypothetical protein
LLSGVTGTRESILTDAGGGVLVLLLEVGLLELVVDWLVVLGVVKVDLLVIFGVVDTMLSDPNSKLRILIDCEDRVPKCVSTKAYVPVSLTIEY